VTVKRGRPKGSRNRVYSPVAAEGKRTTRSLKASTSLNTTSKQAYIAYVEDDPDETPYDPHDFSFDPSYEDSNGEQDQDYVDNRVPDDKSEYHHAFYTGAESNPCDPTTLEEAKARSDWPLWKTAIAVEYRALRRKKTWTLLKRYEVPNNQKVLRGRLVFKTKRNKEGKIERYKV
jgi:hypothetical protein